MQFLSYNLFISFILLYISIYEILRDGFILLNKNQFQICRSLVIRKRDFREILCKHNNRKREGGVLFTFGYSRVLSVHGIFHSERKDSDVANA